MTEVVALSNGATEDEGRLEDEHFRRIVNAFRFYRAHALQRLNKTECYLNSLPSNHQLLLRSYREHLSTVRDAIHHNYEIIKLIIRDVSQMFENVTRPLEDDNSTVKPVNFASTLDMEKIQSTLKQFVRDWSEDGAEERKQCYQPILDEIRLRFPSSMCDPSSINILVPGAGLGRLAYEIARCGYVCQGNEFSFFMLFASNFVLNKCRGVNVYKIYPWIHHYCNNLRNGDQTQYILFPDVNPSDLPADSSFSMAAGDFLEVYSENDVWDCVATCFFLDTANNIITYIETIWNILKPGGIWVNLGPLLYHFADMQNENSIEPSYETVREIIQSVGFVMLKEKVNIPTTYAQNPQSMLQYSYKSVLFVCKKDIDKCNK